MRRIVLFAVGLFLTLGAAEASAVAIRPSGVVSELASVKDQGPLIHDLGFLPPAPSPADPVQAQPLSTVSTAEAVPELSTWAMTLLCLAGLGLATFKKGRKDRLSPGLE